MVIPHACERDSATVFTKAMRMGDHRRLGQTAFLTPRTIEARQRLGCRIRVADGRERTYLMLEVLEKAVATNAQP